MLVSTLFVLLMSANPDAAFAVPANTCTDPLLSYTYDTASSQDHTMATCLICADSATWRLIDAAGGKRVVTRAIQDISSLRGAVEQIQLGNITESLDGQSDAPTIFYWAHPSNGPKFLLTARQCDHVWNNDATPTQTLIETINAVCSGPL